MGVLQKKHYKLHLLYGCAKNVILAELHKRQHEKNGISSFVSPSLTLLPNAQTDTLAQNLEANTCLLQTGKTNSMEMHWWQCMDRCSSKSYGNKILYPMC